MNHVLSGWPSQKSPLCSPLLSPRITCPSALSQIMTVTLQIFLSWESIFLVVFEQTQYSTNSLHLQSTDIQSTVHSLNISMAKDGESAFQERALVHSTALLGIVQHEKLQQLIPTSSFARTPGQK